VIASGSCPECSLSPLELCLYWGYSAESFETRTADGFSLELVRLRGDSTSRGVVLLQHGLLDAASTWVINGPKQSLGFILADQGYEVWLSNSRGNTYSPPKHWQFSFDDMAEFDIPATVDFVLAQSNASSLAYVGHSQGTTIAFASLSQNPSLARKIDLFIALAPVAYVFNQKSLLIQYLSTLEVDVLLQFFGQEQFLPSGKLIRSVSGVN
jgi:pimeloyl-ACP methyl ester carboxylesterase